MIIGTIVSLDGYAIEKCRIAALTNRDNHQGFRFECKSDSYTTSCKLSETFPDNSVMYCTFNKTENYNKYVKHENFQGFNLVKSHCNGENRKSHEFYSRIEHGEMLQENQCILDVKDIDMSGIPLNVLKHS